MTATGGRSVLVLEILKFVPRCAELLMVPLKLLICFFSGSLTLFRYICFIHIFFNFLILFPIFLLHLFLLSCFMSIYYSMAFFFSGYVGTNFSNDDFFLVNLLVSYGIISLKSFFKTFFYILFLK